MLSVYPTPNWALVAGTPQNPPAFRSVWHETSGAVRGMLGLGDNAGLQEHVLEVGPVGTAPKRYLFLQLVSEPMEDARAYRLHWGLIRARRLDDGGPDYRLQFAVFSGVCDAQGNWISPLQIDGISGPAVSGARQLTTYLHPTYRTHNLPYWYAAARGYYERYFNFPPGSRYVLEIGVSAVNLSGPVACGIEWGHVAGPRLSAEEPEDDGCPFFDVLYLVGEAMPTSDMFTPPHAPHRRLGFSAEPVEAAGNVLNSSFLNGEE